MKKYILCLMAFLGSCTLSAQNDTIMASSASGSNIIFKGLVYGMTPREAKNEFLTNKEDYTNVDLGNGFVWRSYKQNLIFLNDSLVGITFVPYHPLALTNDNAIAYLEFTKAFFERKGYKVFLEPDNWQYPLLFHSFFGLVMYNPERTIIVQMYPGTYKINYSTGYTASLKVLSYDWFMKAYKAYNDNLKGKSDNSGF
jgi:hypothetical protein